MLMDITITLYVREMSDIQQLMDITVTPNVQEMTDIQQLVQDLLLKVIPRLKLGSFSFQQKLQKQYCCNIMPVQRLAAIF